MRSLCYSCAHVRRVVSGTGSTFHLCQLSQTDSRFAKYPPQPVLRCPGYLDKSPNTFTLIMLPGTFAICRLPGDAQTPDWATGRFLSITRTPDELSIVCPQEDVPNDVRRELAWKCLRVSGPLDFSLVGVIASLTGTLAKANISVFVISTFDTDLLLVKQNDLERATAALRTAGHAIQ